MCEPVPPATTAGRTRRMPPGWASPRAMIAGTSRINATRSASRVAPATHFTFASSTEGEDHDLALADELVAHERVAVAAVIHEHEMQLGHVRAIVELEHLLEADQRHVLAPHHADLALADHLDVGRLDR